MRNLQITVFCFFALAGSLVAQTAHWEPSGGSLAFGQSSQLQLNFEGCAPKGQPTIPPTDGLSLQYAGESSQTSIINGSFSRSETLTYAARPTKKSGVSIPEFSVDTDKGRITVPAASFSVGDATVGNGVSLESIASSNFLVPASVWAGEVFPIEYNLNVRQRNAPNPQNLLGSLLDWKPGPLILEDWSKPAARDSLVNGDNYITVYQKARATVAKPGTVTLNEGTQLVNIAKGVDFFGRYVLDQFSITSNHPTIQVKPLPAPAPAGFNGAVGQFTLKSTVVPTTASVGEPITWTLNLSGTGNWPDLAGLPARTVSKDFRAVQPQAHRTPKEGMLFEASLVEDVVLIPTKPGTYTLNATTWTYFDPAKGEYQTVTTPAATITISAAPEASPPSASYPAPGYDAATNAGKPPAMPKGIPRDPLGDQGPVSTPWSRENFIAVLCAPIAAVGLVWLLLALRQAVRNDPARFRREAKQRLARTLSLLNASKNPSETSSLLLEWQRDVALLWEFPFAVPAATNFSKDEPRWIKLWNECERTLYREGTPLPSDWINQAAEALQEKAVPRFSFWQLFRLKNLLPFAAMVVLGLLFSAVPVRADQAGDAYAHGDFSAAEKAWRDKVAREPANPAAHHNLSLALAQQDRWGEAAAHAAAAFAQNPSSDAVRWNLAYTMERAGYAPSVFSGFAAAHPPHQVARQFSPTQWQWIAVLGVTFAATGVVLLLVRAYGKSGRWLKYAAVVFFTFASVTGAAATLSLWVYSPVNDARSVVVWRASTLRSIPTDVETPQKTSPLSAGSVAIVDQNFIGKTWAHLVFANGQTGWVRQEDLVSLWR